MWLFGEKKIVKSWFQKIESQDQNVKLKPIKFTLLATENA